MWHSRGMDLSVHPAAERDADAVARIYIESWNDGLGDLVGMRMFDSEVIARWVRDLGAGRPRWWVAERKDEIVGFVGVGPSRDPIQSGLGELDTIAVAPSRWRTGVGRSLMAVALDALAENFRAAILWTVAGYERGHRFYQAMGWNPDGGTRAEGREVSFRHHLEGRKSTPMFRMPAG